MEKEKTKISKEQATRYWLVIVGFIKAQEKSSEVSNLVNELNNYFGIE